MAKLIANLVAFQIGWFSCVISMAKGAPWIGMAVAGVVVVGHVVTAPARLRELLALLTIGCVGATVDTALAASGWVALSHFAESLPLVFGWFVAFWANFATTLTRSLAWLRAKPIYAVVFGAIGGPPAYFGAQALGALELQGSVLSSALVYGAYWAVATPLALWTAHRFSRVDRAPAAALEEHGNGVGA